MIVEVLQSDPLGRLPEVRPAPAPEEHDRDRQRQQGGELRVGRVGARQGHEAERSQEETEQDAVEEVVPERPAAVELGLEDIAEEPPYNILTYHILL